VRYRITRRLRILGQWADVPAADSCNHVVLAPAIDDPPPPSSIHAEGDGAPLGAEDASSRCSSPAGRRGRRWEGEVRASATARVKGVLALGAPVAWRYLAILVQFLVFLLVARRLPVPDAAFYFSAFGVVTVASFTVGLGMPDGAVRQLPSFAAEQADEDALELVRSVLRFAVATVSVPLVLLTILYTTSNRAGPSTMLVGLWWAGYCTVFTLAQLITGLGRPATGAFAAYSATNICYVCTVVPYLLLSPDPTLRGALATGVIAVAIACIGLAILLGRLLAPMRIRAGAFSVDPDSRTLMQPRLRRSRVRRSTSSTGSRHGRRALQDGLPIVCTRLLQSSLPWTPVWVLTIISLPLEAATYAAASRFVVAATAVIAALRFAVRPQVVVLFKENKRSEIAQLSRRASKLAAVPPLLALGVLLVGGQEAMTYILGEAYSGAGLVLMVLLLGVLGEAYGGVSDEILKMIGQARIVIVTLTISVALQLLGTLALARVGVVAVAGVSALAFATQYLLQVEWLRRRADMPIWRMPMRRNARTA